MFPFVILSRVSSWHGLVSLRICNNNNDAKVLYYKTKVSAFSREWKQKYKAQRKLDAFLRFERLI